VVFARALVGPELTLQGNLDPCILLSTPEIIAEKARALIQAGSGHRHILNLGHGILPMTPVENARAFIDAAKHSNA
jgi:uroporphyrinogen decarboxylase